MNTYQEVAPSAVRSASWASRHSNVQGRACHLIIDITAVPGIDTVTATIRGIDKSSGKTYALLASAALVATGTTVLKIGPGLPVSANASANDVLPKDIEINFAHSAGGNFTYSAGLHIVD